MGITEGPVLEDQLRETVAEHLATGYSRDKNQTGQSALISISVVHPRYLHF